jgi:hypothetical protein
MVDGIAMICTSVSLGNYDLESIIQWENYKYNAGDLVAKKGLGVNGHFRITLDRRSIKFEGSIHKYWNIKKQNGGVNYNQFGYLEFLEAVEFFKNEYQIDPAYCRMTNVEYGMNVELEGFEDLVLQDFLRRNFLYERKSAKFPTVEDQFSKPGIMLVYPYTQHNKSLQNNLGSQVLRFEKKLTKNEKIVSVLNSRVLSDLTDQSTFMSMHGDLKKTFESIVIADSKVLPEGISDADKALFDVFFSRAKTETLKSQLKSEPFRLRKRRFENLLTGSNMSAIKEKILRQMEEQSKDLLQKSEAGVLTSM